MFTQRADVGGRASSQVNFPNVSVLRLRVGARPEGRDPLGLLCSASQMAPGSFSFPRTEGGVGAGDGGVVRPADRHLLTHVLLKRLAMAVRHLGS